LRLALSSIASSYNGTLLDFGCGGSPYRQLFPGTIYRRADVLPANDIDYVIRPDCGIDCPGEEFDTILSTQVLEHVVDSKRYIAEALRLLKPGGQLILSTHGSFFDHGCPNDFRRWTADGLQADLKSGGFEISLAHKLTTNMRALLFLGENYLGHLWYSRKTILGIGLFSFQHLFWKNRERRHKWIDKEFPECRVKLADAPDPFYICILVVATKPFPQA
jgi:SAM-dependent methyltransferase